MEVTTSGILSILMLIAYEISKEMKMTRLHRTLIAIAVIASFVLLFLTSAMACCTIT